MKDENKADLIAAIRQQLAQAGGRLSFAEFMQQALYHPQWGYYTAPRTRIGKEGDFYTSTSVDACFGQLIARQLEQMWRLLDRQPFVIAEQGAGEGHLALDILAAMAAEFPEFYAAARYRIVEISADNRQRQQQLLKEHRDAGRVDWCELAQLQGMQGCFLSNELVDAFPVHLLETRAGKLQEIYVVATQDGFCEQLGELSNPALQDYFLAAGIAPKEGNRCEVNLNAGPWMAEVAGLLQRGFVLTIDYGYLADELYAPWRHAGTFLCYHRHQTNEEPFLRIGCQDMTAHVDFSHLQRVGQEQGLETLYYGQQYQFLMGLGFVQRLMELQAQESDPRKAQAIRMKLKNLILPDGGMGESFKVLIQGKGVGQPELLCQRRIQDLPM